VQREFKSLWETFQLYGKVAVAYDFDFGITERNNVNAGLAFKLPLSDRVLDLSAGGSLDGKRVGQRTFKAQETFEQMVERDQWCANFKVRDENLLYPITGSIGLRKVVKTFIAISEAGGGKDSFVDTLTFTTTVSGKIGGVIKINPVPNSFRLVSADAAIAGDRTDVHKLVISLAFPAREQRDRDPNTVKQSKLKQCNQSGICVEDEYPLNPVWRARYNICVADARGREDTFKVLRDSPPEVYCLTYADAFVSRHVDPKIQQRFTTPGWLLR
jgi:hypothetical protein